MFENKDLTDNDTQIVSSEAKEESKDSTRKGLTSSASPEVLPSQEEQTPIQGYPPDMPSPKPHEEEKHWYVLRATYGRELKAKEYLDDHDIKTFLPLQKVVKRVDKRLRKSEEPLLKNIFFALGTDSSLKEYVYDNVHLPYLRFYYERFSNPDGSLSKRPLIIPDYQMESFTLTTHPENHKELDDCFNIEGVFTPSDFSEQKVSVKFDVILDPFIDIHIDYITPYCNSFARYVSCGYCANQNLNLDMYNVFTNMIITNTSVIANCIGLPEDLISAINLYNQGKYKVHIDSVFAENNISDFLERSFNQKHFGKVIFHY